MGLQPAAVHLLDSSGNAAGSPCLVKSFFRWWRADPLRSLLHYFGDLGKVTGNDGNGATGGSRVGIKPSTSFHYLPIRHHIPKADLDHSLFELGDGSDVGWPHGIGLCALQDIQDLGSRV